MGTERFTLIHETVQSMPMPTHPDCRIAQDEIVGRWDAYPGNEEIDQVITRLRTEEPGDTTLEQNLTLQTEERILKLGKLALWRTASKKVVATF